MTLNAGLYIHIPFCIRKCPYCDFYSISDFTMIQPFAEALTAEMRMKKDGGGFDGVLFDSVYIGGGTPTVMGARAIGRIMAAAVKAFSIDPAAEITIETNPCAITRAQLADLRRIGINRINIGVQSFDDANLAFLGRRHTAADAVSAVGRAEKSGFENIGIDLMYALPGQKPENWQKDLEKALSMAPAHISAYMLTLEPGTPMDSARIAGKFVPQPNDVQGAFFMMTGRMLAEKGYDHYEISNFASASPDAPPKRSRHNAKYWNNHPYLGLGPAAHSYYPHPACRSANVRSVRRYIGRIDGGKLPVKTTEALDSTQQMIEALYLGLRQADGIAFDVFNHRFQTDFMDVFSEPVERFEAEGLLVADGGACRPTLAGMRMQESLAAAFIDRI